MTKIAQHSQQYITQEQKVNESNGWYVVERDGYKAVTETPHYAQMKGYAVLSGPLNYHDAKEMTK